MIGNVHECCKLHKLNENAKCPFYQVIPSYDIFVPSRTSCDYFTCILFLQKHANADICKLSNVTVYINPSNKFRISIFEMFEIPLSYQMLMSCVIFCQAMAILTLISCKHDPSSVLIDPRYLNCVNFSYTDQTTTFRFSIFLTF